jgi:hypothetical protein
MSAFDIGTEAKAKQRALILNALRTGPPDFSGFALSQFCFS